MEKLPKISKKALKDFYELHSLISQMYNNEINDRNPERGDLREVFYKKAESICQKWIYSQPPIN